jgi:hypothetical protein
MPSTGFTIFAVSRVEGKIYQHVKVTTIQFRAGRVEFGPNKVSQMTRAVPEPQNAF